MSEAPELSKLNKIRWIQVAISTVIISLGGGIVSNCIAIFAIPVSEGLHISRTMYFSTQTMFFASVMVGSLTAGRLIEHFGMIRVVRIMGIFVGAAYFLNSLVQNFTMFAALSIILGITSTYITTIPLSLLVRKWFPHDFGLPLGIVLMGSGLGGLVFSQVATILIETLGWRFAYAALGILILVVVEGIAWFMLRLPTGAEFRCLCSEKQAVASENVKRPKAHSNNPLKTDLKRPSFWVVMGFGTLLGSASYATLCLTSVYLQDQGYAASTASLIYGISMGALAVGKIVYGRIYDRCGNIVFTAVGMIAVLIGMVGLCFVKIPGMMVLVLFGAFLGCPTGSVAQAPEVRYFLGEKDFAEKLGIYTAFGSLGGAISPTIANLMYERSNTYASFYIFTFVATSIGLLLFLLDAARVKGKEVEI